MWNSTKLCFPLNTYTSKRTSQRSVHDCACKKRQQREHLSEMGTHTYFLRISSHGPCDKDATFSRIHKVPHLSVRSCQFSIQGELVSGKRYESACSPTHHQYRHSLQNAFFPPKSMSLTSYKQHPIVIFFTDNVSQQPCSSPLPNSRCTLLNCDMW